MPLIGGCVNDLHGSGNFTNCSGKPVGRNRVSKDKNIETIGKKIKSNGFCFSGAYNTVPTTRTNQQHWAFLNIYSNFIVMIVNISS